MRNPYVTRWKKSILSWVVFFSTVIVLSATYATYNTLSTVSPGQVLSVGLWTQLKENFDDLNTRVSLLTSQMNSVIAGEATSGTVSAPTGGSTSVTNYTIDSTVTAGGWFNASTGIFQPTTAGRYLITWNAYSISPAWALTVCKNNVCVRGGWSVSTVGNGSLAHISKIVYLNGTTDTASLKIVNWSGYSVSINDVNITWSKL